MLTNEANARDAQLRIHEQSLFETLSATVDDDGVIEVRGHGDDGGFYPTIVARLDPDRAAWLATTLTNLVRRAA